MGHCLLLPHLRSAALARSSNAFVLILRPLMLMLGPLLMLFTKQGWLLPTVLLPLLLPRLPAD
jgi:hypothetical protein